MFIERPRSFIHSSLLLVHGELDAEVGDLFTPEYKFCRRGFPVSRKQEQDLKLNTCIRTISPNLFTYLFYLFSHFHHSREAGCGGGRTTERGSKLSAPIYPPNHDIPLKTDHNTGNYTPYSLRQVCGFFYVPQDYEH